ncbi:DUF1697 domain-containing protein [Rhodopirellula sp. ICT_H3.1]|uniref:DUF1697 domain-containing protein n=2 Tax=Aporhodopirellula aestuarii TaxID=2950107 RepID=A0ABT0TY35_9BACT|nr:DUF1697 domain-containing protein [Aporhodopirellula aestuarii]
MAMWVALFRGVNVGGKNLMPMAELTRVLESLACTHVRTYIQSGNVVFGSRMSNREKLTERVIDAVEETFGFRSPLILLTTDEFLEALKKNPFLEAVAVPKSLHFYFLAEKPKTPDLDGIEQLAISTESFCLTDRVFYLHAPDGVGTSKLAARAERKLGVVATARNYATVDKIRAMIEAA